MTKLTESDLKNRLEHGVWLDEVDRSFRDWRAAPNTEKPAHLLSGMMLTWAESWRLTNPTDFAPAQHTYIARSVQAQVSKSASEREAAAVEVRRRDRTYQQILLLMTLLAIVMLAPTALRTAVNLTDVAVQQAPAMDAPTRPAASAAVIITQDAPESTGTPEADPWRHLRLLDQAQEAVRDGRPEDARMFALAATAETLRQAATSPSDAKTTAQLLSLAARMSQSHANSSGFDNIRIEPHSAATCSGNRVLARGAEGDVMVADLAVRSLQRTPIEPAHRLLPRAVTASCRLAVATNEDHEVLLVALDGRAVTRRIGSHDAPLISARISADGRRIASVARDGAAKVWDTTSNRVVARFSSESEPLAGAALSENGSLLVTWTEGREAALRDVATGKQIGLLAGHASRVIDTRFTDDGRHLLTVSVDGTAKVWTTSTSALVATLRPQHGSIVEAWLSVDASRVVARLDDDRLQVWDAIRGVRLASLAVTDEKIHQLAMDPRATLIATSDHLGMTTVWHAGTGRVLLSIDHSGGQVQALTVAADASTLTAVTTTGPSTWPLPQSLETAAAMLIAHGACADGNRRAAQGLAQTLARHCDTKAAQPAPNE